MTYITKLRSPIARVWGRSVVAAVLMMVCAMSMSVLLLAPDLAAWMDGSFEGAEGVARVAAAVVGMSIPTALALVLLLLLARIEKVRLVDYLGAGRLWRDLVIWTVVAGLVTTAVVGTVHLLGLDTDRAAGQATAAGVPVWAVLVYGLARAFLLQGIQEELWLRGFAWRHVRAAGWTTFVATTLVFTALHLLSSGGQQDATERVLYLALAFGMGFLAGAVRWCTGSVGGAIGVHSGIHVGFIPLALLGWGLGPVGWVAVGLAHTAIGVGLLAIRRPWRSVATSSATALAASRP